MDTDIIVSYIKKGETDQKRLGLELEHFVLDPSGQGITFDQLSPVLELTGRNIGADIIYIDGHPMGYLTPEYTVTLEPSCQLEISVSPYESLQDIRRVYRSFYDLWSGILGRMGYSIVTRGLHPLVETGRGTPSNLPLIPKERYWLMDKYFLKSGRYGQHMMRASAATQVSLDFRSEKDMARKLRILEILSPFFMLLMENKTDPESTLGDPEKKYLLRNQVWEDLDPARTGYLPGSLAPGYGYRDYAETVLNRPLILMTEDGKTVDTGEKTARQLGSITPETAGHVISMFFFQIRIKSYLEVRVADSVSIEKALGYAALLKGLIYSEKNLSRLEEILRDVTGEEPLRRTEEEVERHGSSGISYGGLTAGEWSRKILDMAWHGLEDPEEAKLLQVFETQRTAGKEVS